MNRTVSKALLCVLVFLSPAAVAGAPLHDEYIEGPGVIVDAHCGGEMTAEAAAKHPRACSLKAECAAAGYGLVIGGKFRPFDAKGNELAAAILKASKSTENVRAYVLGTLKHSGTIAVDELKAE